MSLEPLISYLFRGDRPTALEAAGARDAKERGLFVPPDPRMESEQSPHSMPEGLDGYIISIRDLSHAFGHGEGRRTVLKGISVDFYPGEIVIVMGPSGAGKTTLLTLAGALRSIQDGRITISGLEAQGADPKRQCEIRQRIGFIFQHHNLLESLTVCENIQMGLAHVKRLPLGESRRRALEILTRVGLLDHAEKHPSEMSGGQRQRVAIARALVRQPAIILADEPTAALDSHSGREIVSLLQELARERHCAILLVTHDNRILDIADRILTLEDGCIEENNLALDRVRQGLRALMQAISTYPSEGLQNRQTCLHQLERWSHTASVLALRQLNTQLAEETLYLDQTAKLLSSIESSTWNFMDLHSRSQAHPAIHGLHQSLEFLLLTTADLMKTGREEDRQQLLQLTAHRGDLMESLRRKYDSPSRDPEPFFDLTLQFARIIQDLHELAGIWRMQYEA